MKTKSSNQIIMLKYLILIMGLFAHSQSFSQEKVEIERPIKHTEVVEAAKQYVCDLFPKARIRWMYEIRNEGNSVEAKLKDGKIKYSVEFSTKGEFEDLEVTIDKDVIDKEIWELISKKLSQDFDRYKIKKIQHHYSGDDEEIKKLFKGGEYDRSYIQQLFEIVVYGEKDKEQSSFEYTFKINGDFVNRQRNAEVNTDNLLF